MSIQLTTADKILFEHKSKPCEHHIWEKEYHKGSATGDYRCRICGKEIWEGDLKNEKTIIRE